MIVVTSCFPESTPNDLTDPIRPTRSDRQTDPVVRLDRPDRITRLKAYHYSQLCIEFVILSACGCCQVDAADALLAPAAAAASGDAEEPCVF